MIIIQKILGALGNGGNYLLKKVIINRFRTLTLTFQFKSKFPNIISAALTSNAEITVRLIWR